MKRPNRDIKIQVRITADEKNMLDKMAEANREFSISKIVREAINEKYKEYKNGIEIFTVA